MTSRHRLSESCDGCSLRNCARGSDLSWDKNERSAASRCSGDSDCLNRDRLNRRGLLGRRWLSSNCDNRLSGGCFRRCWLDSDGSCRLRLRLSNNRDFGRRNSDRCRLDGNDDFRWRSANCNCGLRSRGGGLSGFRGLRSKG